MPNDLLIKGAKFCGILQETVMYKDNKFFIVGVLELIYAKVQKLKIKKHLIYKNIAITKLKKMISIKLLEKTLKEILLD